MMSIQSCFRCTTSTFSARISVSLYARYYLECLSVCLYLINDGFIELPLREKKCHEHTGMACYVELWKIHAKQ